MNNAAAIIRSLIIYGLCLPLAVYLGYLMALPWGRGDYAFVLLVIALPLIPILLKWHHLFLVLSWNMSMVLFFVQGSPYLWMLMTALSLGLTVLQHILKRDIKFASVSSVTWPLLFLAVVILITAKLTGGIGLAAFGGSAVGGKRYIQLFCAIAGYFAISSHRVVLGKGGVYVALYFLGALTLVIGSLAPWLPSGLHVILALFPVEDMSALTGGGTFSEYTRLSGVALAALTVLYFLLARHGMQGLLASGERFRFLPLQFRGGFGINPPWRFLAVLIIVWLALMGGYRSHLITILVLCTMLFFIEGLHRTKLAPIFLLVGILGAVVTISFVEKLPYTVQRSLSFLPIEVSPLARQNAEESSEWRLKMWEEVLPTVPQYLLVGKGYGIDARALEMQESVSAAQSDNQARSAILAQDYHNGPLSLVIPLGIFGVIGFLWFMVASFRVLLNNYRHGAPVNHRLNVFLLAFFLTKTLFFFVIYGSFQNDLSIFTGIVALSASINGGMCKPAPVTKPNPAYLPFRLPKPLRA
jgi:hypothetical protein